MVDKAAGKKNRKRQLNVIYFVDSAKTRSFRFPIERLHLALTVLVVGAIWSVGSCFLIYKQFKNWQDQHEQLVHAKEAIFEYQLQHEGVVEKAYPGLVANNASEQKQTTAAKEPEPKAEQGVETAAVASSTSLQDAAPPTEAVSGQPPAATEKQVVKVANPQIREQNGRLTMRFRLENGSSPNKADGFIWAVAQFEGADGTKKTVTIPENLALDDQGNPKRIGAAQRYSIRYYKAEEFRFAAIANATGKYTSIFVGLTDREGNIISTYNIPADIAVSAAAPTPTVAPSAVPAPTTGATQNMNGSSGSVPAATGNGELATKNE